MSSIAEAFSNFAKMPAQKNEELNVIEVTKLALDIFNEHNIKFETQKERISILFDRTQLIRVITNLIKNAIQAEASEIVVKIRDVENNVIISISDNGVGIENENKSKVFEPKFTTKNSGMGLGLAMVKNIIQTYKGEITFESTINKGTVFKVTLPKN